MRSHARGPMRPKFCINSAVPKIRGRREDRVRAASAVSRANRCNKMRARARLAIRRCIAAIRVTEQTACAELGLEIAIPAIGREIT